MCNRNNCVYLSVIIGILAGVTLGILYSFGLIAVGVIFWAYLILGAAAILIAPLYANKTTYGNEKNCFCNLKNFILAAAIGSIILAAVGLIVVVVAPIIVSSIIIGIATFFAATLLSLVVCLVNCLCSKYN